MSHQLPRSSSPHRYSCARFVQAASCAAARERRRRRLSIPASLLVASAGRRRRRRHDRAPGTVDHAQGGAATGGGPAPAGPAPGTQVGDDLAEAGGGADPGTHDSRRRPVSDGVGTCTVSRTNCAIALCNRIVQPHYATTLFDRVVQQHCAIASCNRIVQPWRADLHSASRQSFCGNWLVVWQPPNPQVPIKHSYDRLG